MKNDAHEVAEYPTILGIEYNSADFVLPQSALASWTWSANAEALAEISAAGGSIRALPSTLEQQSHPILKHLFKQKQPDQFWIQYLARSVNGIEIKIPDQVEIKHELQLQINFEDSKSAQLTTFIHLGANSRLQLRQNVDFLTENSHANLMVGGQLESGSTLKYQTEVRSQQPVKTLLLGSLNCERDAKVEWNLLPQTRGKMLGDLGIRLTEIGSEAELNVGCYGQKDDWIGIQGTIEHRAPKTYARIKMRGVLYENAKVNFTSIGQINKGAIGANAGQESRLMTVAPHAKGSVNPVLIIDENDVKAGHAASVGQYDEAELYYLLSRGLQPAQAKQILIDNFMEPVLKKMKRAGDLNDGL
jgi:Fe-S cluster assembly protein SufD